MQQLTIEDEIHNIDPLLWLFLESITRTVKQRQSVQPRLGVFVGLALQVYFSDFVSVLSAQDKLVSRSPPF